MVHKLLRNKLKIRPTQSSGSEVQRQGKEGRETGGKRCGKRRNGKRRKNRAGQGRKHVGGEWRKGKLAHT